MDAFDADVLIYAAIPGHPLGARVRLLFLSEPREGPRLPVGMGSVLLVPELLAKPVRRDDQQEVSQITALLSRLDLRPCDYATAQLATALSARYNLSAPDGVHLATALSAGASRFITNNSKDFKKSIDEIDIVYPQDLPER